jgi:hypothetical protein
MVYKAKKEITQHKPNLTLIHGAEPRTLTYLPSAPKPNLEKHAKTEFLRCCYVGIPHKNNVLTVKGRPPPQYTGLLVFLWFFLIMTEMCYRR